MTAYEKFQQTGENEWNTDFYNVEPGINTLPFRFYNERNDYEEDTYKMVKVNVKKVSHKRNGTMITLDKNGKWYYNKMEEAFKPEDDKAWEAANTGKFK